MSDSDVKKISLSCRLEVVNRLSLYNIFIKTLFLVLSQDPVGPSNRELEKKSCNIVDKIIGLVLSTGQRPEYHFFRIRLYNILSKQCSCFVS